MSTATADIKTRLRNIDAAGPFSRPLRIGDPAQIAGMQVMRGETAFCDQCLHVPSGDRHRQIETVGMRCKCGGVFLPGAALEPYWRQMVYDCEGAC